jgi:hypothetical protein
MSETKVSPISGEAKEWVKNIVEYHYGFTPSQSSKKLNLATKFSLDYLLSLVCYVDVVFNPVCDYC